MGTAGGTGSRRLNAVYVDEVSHMFVFPITPPPLLLSTSHETVSL